MPIKYLTSDTRGLSLIERVIAILILSVSLAGGLSLYFNATSIMSLAMHKKMAVEIAVQEMEKIKDAGYAGLPNPTTGTWQNLSDRTFDLFTAQVRKRITDVSTSPVMKKVELEVSWAEDKHDPRTIKLETLFSLIKS